MRDSEWVSCIEHWSEDELALVNSEGDGTGQCLIKGSDAQGFGGGEPARGYALAFRKVAVT